MNETLIQALLQNGGSLAMAIVFIFYLIKRDKENKETLGAFNKTITNHLEHALKVELSITKSLDHLSSCIATLSLKQENRNRTIDRRHEVEKKEEVN